MRTVSASFDTYDEVSSAVDGLAEMGVACSEITVVSRRRHARARVVEGAGLGAAIGGVAGLLVGFGMIVLSGREWLFGPVWLIPLLIGAAVGGIAGGLVGSKSGAGVENTSPCSKRTRRGSTLLVARVHDDEVGEARAVLLRCGAIDTNAKRGEYATDGWDGFVAKDIWDEDIGREDERLSENGATDRQGRRRHVA